MSDLTQDELEELQTKPLDDMTGPELRAYAVGVVGLDVPEKVTDKASLRYIIDLGSRTPAQASGVDQAPDDSQEFVEDLGNGYERATRPITEVRANGDWRNPFTGFLIYHGQDADPADRARVERDDPGRPFRRDAAGHTFVPVKVGDTVSIDRLIVEGE